MTKQDKDVRAYQQLSTGSFSDPFSFLGPAIDKDQGILRVWVPGAESVYLLVEQERVELEHESYSGFILKQYAPLNEQYYRLAADFSGSEQILDDPYQFHNIYAEYDELHDPKEMYRHMGAQPMTLTRGDECISGVRFLVLAPHASACSLVGEFNQWDDLSLPMQRLDYGIWGLFLPNISAGEKYGFQLKGPRGERLPFKVDPWSFHASLSPHFLSVTFDHSGYQWQDEAWQTREIEPICKQAISVYEVHLGSWMPTQDESISVYRHLADTLAPYVAEMGYTHIEIMPLAEWVDDTGVGQCPVSFFAPTSRYGSPDEFKHFIDCCHQANIGVILAWVAGHFTPHEQGLVEFDGTTLYHHPDPRIGQDQDCHLYFFDYSREHIRRYLVANALFWLEQFHVDGLRVDGVASMLCLDDSRSHEQWQHNIDGGNRNYDASALLKWLNEEVHKCYPRAITIAEDIRMLQGVSEPTFMGGLGFNFHWQVDWVRSSLHFMAALCTEREESLIDMIEPLTSLIGEHSIYPICHDEIAYGRGSLLNQMAGEGKDKLANYRVYFGYVYGLPTKKMHFMGCEFGQNDEWCPSKAMPWQLCNSEAHQGLDILVSDLNKLYRSQAALHELDCDPSGFQWLANEDRQELILAYSRQSSGDDYVLVICNFSMHYYSESQIGVAYEGVYQLLLNTDAACYHGDQGLVSESVESTYMSGEHFNHSITVSIPPLSCLYYRLI
ncbi:1,4-alpha-glucan branching protein GlgB [Vibrio caribbeanicus]|uniref:1,4-alpha-glucan branching protein GlgB n=1 Tax=Vibrio caribbeanicus TaxID=701175 RepID=UPI0030D91B56